MIEAEGRTGTITFDGRRVTIQRKGIVGIATQGGTGEKVIPLRAISAVQWRKPGLFTTGYIEFTMAGSSEVKGGLKGAVNHENSVLFTPRQTQNMLFLRDAVNAAMDEL